MPEENKKKPYTQPQLETLGPMEDLTHGQGWHGDSDQWWIFSWGHPPATS